MVSDLNNVASNEFSPLSRRRSIEDIRRNIPARLFKRDTQRGLLYLARDFAMAAVVWRLGMFIDPLCTDKAVTGVLGSIGSEVLRWSLWCL